MKRDLTNLSLADQCVATMEVLHKRRVGGARETWASDLHAYFKHRAFQTHQQRHEHYAKLLNVAAHALAGHKAQAKLLFRALVKGSVVFAGGDHVIHDGKAWLVTDVLPDEKLQLIGLAGTRIVLAKDCAPDPDFTPVPVYSDATTTG